MGRRKYNPDGCRVVEWTPAGFDTVTVTVKPAGWEETFRFEAEVRPPGPPEIKAEQIAKVIAFAAEHITAWDGLVGGDDAPLPCTDENKRRVLDRHPDLLTLVQAEMFARRDAERPKDSGDGSASSSPIPASTAEPNATQ